MRKGQITQNPFAARREVQKNLATIVAISSAVQKAVSFEAVHQFHRAVMLDLQPFGEDANCGGVSRGKAFQRKQRLKLLRFDACVAGGMLRQVQKAAQFIAKLRQRAIIECPLQSGSPKFTLYRNTM